MASLTQLKYAIAVARHRGFQKAAKACFVTQPTLSMQLRKLEDELGVVLFDRSRKPVAATVEGEILLEQFRLVIREYAQIDEIVQSLHGVVGGSYRLGIIPTMAPFLLPLILPTFGQAFPKVELHIEEITTEEIMRRLIEETLDGGILATPLDDPRIIEFPLAREDFLVLHSPDLTLETDTEDRVVVAELPVEKLLMMREGHCLRAQTLDLCALGAQADHAQRFVIEAGSMATLCTMVSQGPFFTIIPALAAKEWMARGGDGEVREIAGLVPYRQIGLVVHRAETRRAVRDALIDEARRVLEPLEAENRSRRSAPTRPI